MGLLYVDGFETYGNTVNATLSTGDITRRWQAFLETSMKIQVGHDGSGKSISLESSSNQLTKAGLDTTNATMVVGVALYINTQIGGIAIQAVRMLSGPTLGAGIQINTDGSVSFRRGTTTVATSTNTGIVTTGNWHYLELKVKTANSGGTYDIYVDGVNELSGTGDTQAGILPYHTGVILSRGTLSGAMYFDDIYILDGAGSVNNDVLGPMYVTTIYPDGDDTTDWTANGGGTHYSEVNSVEFDGDDYIESNTSADQDIFTYGNVSGIGTVAGVQVTTVLRETDAQSLPLKILAVSSGNTVNGGSQTSGSTDWTGITTVFEEDPDGNTWNATTVNSTKFGVEVV